MKICSIYGGGAAGRLVPHVPASMRRSVRNMRAKELVRNERAGGANAIPNRGVMRIGRFLCRNHISATGEHFGKALVVPVVCW